MQPEKICETIEIYRALFKGLGIQEIEFPEDEIVDSREVSLAHCHGMLDQMLAFVRMGRIEKTHRWLGFIQGVLWSNGMYTLNVLMEHNRENAKDGSH